MNEEFFKIPQENLKNENLPIRLCTHIKKLINESKLVPGDKMPSELEISRRTGISRIAIREAFKMLEAQGIIDSRGKKGKFVNSLASYSLDPDLNRLLSIHGDNTEKLIDTKFILDKEIFLLAMNNSNSAQKEKLNTITCSLLDTENYTKIVKFYVNYFKYIYTLSDNQFLCHISYSVNELLQKHLMQISPDRIKKFICSSTLKTQINSITEYFCKEKIELCINSLKRHNNSLKKL